MWQKPWTLVSDIFDFESNWAVCCCVSLGKLLNSLSLHFLTYARELIETPTFQDNGIKYMKCLVLSVSSTMKGLTV